MFNLPTPDNRLPHKAEVLALRTARAGGDTIVIAADLQDQRPVYVGVLAGADFVVLPSVLRYSPDLPRNPT